MARLAIGRLTPVFFAVSVMFLVYAHFRAWRHRGGSRIVRIILWINTGVVVWLWYDRVRVWLRW